MLGLIKKDLYMLKSLSASFYLIIAVVVLAQMITGNIGMLTVLSTVMFSTISINLLAYDRQCEWEQYAAALPVTRKQIVTAHYIISYAAATAGAVLGLVLGMVSKIIGSGNIPTEEIIQTSVSNLIGILIYMNINIPLIYKLGVEKSRVLIIFIILIPLSVLPVLLKSDSFVESVKSLSIHSTAGTVIIIILLLAVISAVSIAVSCAIYEKKEF